MTKALLVFAVNMKFSLSFNCSTKSASYLESSSVQLAHLLCYDLVVYENVSSLSQTNVECLMKESA